MPKRTHSTPKDPAASGTLRTSISLPQALHQDAQQIMQDDRCTSFSELVAFLIRLRKIERQRLHVA